MTMKFSSYSSSGKQNAKSLFSSQNPMLQKN